MNETTNPTNPNRRLSARIMSALKDADQALAAGLIDRADEYLVTAEGLCDDLAPAWQEMAGPALDAMADKIVAAQARTHDARKGEGAFSYAE